MSTVSILTKSYLAGLGVTEQEALAFVLENLADPGSIYEICVKFGISTQMLAEIVESAEPGVDANGVRNFFEDRGFDALQMDLAYFNALRTKSSLSNYTSINDTITLGDGDDYVDGGLGNDTIKGNGGNDVLIGGSGDDNIDGGRGADYIAGGFGKDSLYGGKHYEYKWVNGYYLGNQWIPSYSYYEADYSPNVIYGEGGDDYIVGGYGADVLDGGDAADTIYGGGSIGETVFDHDLIYGRGGDDSLYGEEGNDVIYGGSGNDRIFGGAGADTIYGNEDDDYLDAGSDDQVDTVFGGDGNDKIFIYAGDQANGGAGNDQIRFDGPYTAKAVSTAKIVAGEGADKILLYGLGESTRVILDLIETTQSKDDITNWSFNGSPTDVTLEILGFDIKNDTFGIGRFDIYGSTNWEYSAGSTSIYSPKNWTQILTDSTTPYVLESSVSPKTPESYGKGFFVVQGASAVASDIETVAAFIDAYGNNAAYGKEESHYFLINVGNNNSALYLFKDDSGADNNVVPDELTPVALFVGVRTDSYTTADLINVFV